MLFKIKIGSGTTGTDGRNKKKLSMKMKKGSSKASKVAGEGLDEEIKCILDN